MPAHAKIWHVAFVCFIRYVSVLRLVRVIGSEGGIYQFSASHKDASVNHLFHVYVNSKLIFISLFYNNNKNYSFFHSNVCPLSLSLKGKPVIIAQEGPVDGQVRCIAAGHPVPKISWYFCELPHTRYAWNISKFFHKKGVNIFFITVSLSWQRQRIKIHRCYLCKKWVFDILNALSYSSLYSLFMNHCRKERVQEV